MIKANELRLGNLVIDTNTGQPAPVTAEVLQFMERLPSAHSLEPIPLTSKVLQQFGYELHEGKYWHNRHSFRGAEDSDDNRLYIEETTAADLFVVASNYYGGYRVEIESAHQLQNLFFALTGEELPVNL